tara:strand:+ start:12 stop:353 length:342 start_codon:yes stop_codon:yes gene_type:complete
MSRLLATRLPISMGSEVTPDIYNRLVRILEINLGTFDPDNTRQITTAERDTLKFNVGSLIWNTDVEVLQVWTGYNWLDIGQRLIDRGYEATASVGKVTVALDGATSIEVGVNN